MKWAGHVARIGRHLKGYQDVCRRLLKWGLETGCSGIIWIDLPMDRDWQKALVNMVMNPWIVRSYQVALQPGASQEALNTMKLDKLKKKKK
jgi:hypothetical protein